MFHFALLVLGQTQPQLTDLQLLDQLKDHGFLAMVAGVLYLAIGFIRRPAVQNLLGSISAKLQWSHWPKWACILFVFAASLLGLVVEAFTAGQAWGAMMAVGILVKAALAAAGAMAADSAVSTLSKPKPMDPEKTPVNP
jgi:hypothetical protein